MLFAPVVIGGSCYFGTGFSTALKTALKEFEVKFRA